MRRRTFAKIFTRMRSFVYYQLSVFLLSICLLSASCSPNNVKKDNSLKKYFDDNKAAGCFALLDNGTGKFTIYNIGRYRDSAYLPASTFKIVNSLIGLQFGKISPDSMNTKWNDVKRPADEWKEDQEVARRLGKDTMQFWLDSLKYGTQNKKEKVVIRSNVDTFWLDNSLKITPDQELGLVKRLYFDDLPFFKSYQEMVKRAMLFEDNSNYRLAYKTGWGFDEKGNNIGWMVGWVEENEHAYFFVLNLQSPDKDYDMVKARMNILKGILKQLGFLEGKM